MDVEVKREELLFENDVQEEKVVVKEEPEEFVTTENELQDPENEASGFIHKCIAPCRSRFTRRCYLEIHLKRHSSSTYCTLCSRDFESSVTYLKHLSRHLKTKAKEYEEENLFCFHCCSQHVSKKALQYHGRTYCVQNKNFEQKKKQKNRCMKLLYQKRKNLQKPVNEAANANVKLEEAEHVMDKDECEFEDSPEYITISALTDLTSKDCNEASNVDVVKQENKDIVEYTAEEKPTVLTSKGYDEASKVDVVKQEIEDTVEYTAEVNELAKEEEGSSNDYEAEENAIMQDQNAAEGNEDARNSINSDLWRSADNYPACRICGAKFRYTPSRDIHEIVHNETMVCTLCDNLPFHKLNDLKSHVFRHLKEKEAELKHIELQCPYCRQRFTTRKIVMLHLRTHTDERPFKCDICGKAFRQMSSLSTHLVTHSKEKAYICKDCGGEYTTASSLKRHIRKMHNMQRSIKCAHCSLTFHNVKAVQEHRTTAHVNKLYKRYCSLCNEYFFSKINYSAHTKMHRSSL